MPAMVAGISLLAVVRGCSPAGGRGNPGQPAGEFHDVTSSAGLRFTYDNDASADHRYIETTGGGCAFLDYDSDGLLDVFAVQSGPAPGNPARYRPRCALYRNRGDGTFEDSTTAAGLDLDLGYAQGVGAADYDNDGWTDLLVTGYGGVHLLHNRRGHFRNVTRTAGLTEPGEAHWSTSAAWADFDRDGYLDLFICRYVSWFPDADRPCYDSGDHRIYCRPTIYPGDRSILYRNCRDGRFRDVTARAFPAAMNDKALGALWLDYNGDGWPDLFVTNDMERNRLYSNRRDGTFEDEAAPAGVATGPEGRALSGMGIAAADFHGSGRDDVLVVNFSLQPRSYFQSLGDGAFGWATLASGLGDNSQPYLAFGVESLDYNLDGWPDVVVGNGHIDDAVESNGGPVTYREPQQLFRNRGDGRFALDDGAAGDLLRPRVTRGLAVGDFDNDGRSDVLVSGPRERLSLFRNEVTCPYHWVGFRLQGAKSNRDGLGAWVRVRAGSRTQARYVRSGSSYCSRSDTRALFGLGTASGIDSVEITWPLGATQRFRRLAPDRYYVVREDGACLPDTGPGRRRLPPR